MWVAGTRHLSHHYYNSQEPESGIKRKHTDVGPGQTPAPPMYLKASLDYHNTWSSTDMSLHSCAFEMVFLAQQTKICFLLIYGLFPPNISDLWFV